MAPFAPKALKVIEKFRAPAALYRPSSAAGDGWSETSGPKRGGKVIIQIQENADRTGSSIAVVRFELRHGQDVMNARILPGLPIHRKDKTSVFFKAASTSTGRIRRKTIHLLKFQNNDDADDFLMWWYAKNGSIKAWLGEDSNQKNKSTLQLSKRKATDDPTENRLRKRLKDNKAGDDRLFTDSTNKEQNERLMKKHKAIAIDNDDSFDGHTRNDNGSNQDRGKSDEFDETESHGSDDQDSDSDDNKEEVIVDDEYAPQSQEWLISF
jgi:hypothetical protein